MAAAVVRHTLARPRWAASVAHSFRRTFALTARPGKQLIVFEVENHALYSCAHNHNPTSLGKVWLARLDPTHAHDYIMLYSTMHYTRLYAMYIKIFPMQVGEVLRSGWPLGRPSCVQRATCLRWLAWATLPTECGCRSLYWNNQRC